MQPLLTEDEIAGLLQVSTRSIRKARQKGALPYVRLGRLIRYRIEDVQDFVASAVVANDRRATKNIFRRSRQKWVHCRLH